MPSFYYVIETPIGPVCGGPFATADERANAAAQELFDIGADSSDDMYFIQVKDDGFMIADREVTAWYLRDEEDSLDV